VATVPNRMAKYIQVKYCSTLFTDLRTLSAAPRKIIEPPGLLRTIAVVLGTHKMFLFGVSSRYCEGTVSRALVLKSIQVPLPREYVPVPVPASFFVCAVLSSLVL
jgi:hypothetical protein